MKQLLILLLLLCSMSVSAQDVIVKKDGSTVVCHVVELTESEIVYKKWSDLNGSNYVMERSAASAINYQNGKKVNLSEVTNLYKPNNQNDGTQQYNDRALLEMDAAEHTKKKKIRNFKWDIKAGYSIDDLTNWDVKIKSGFDVEIGVLFPFQKTNFMFGGDVFFATLGAKKKKKTNTFTHSLPIV